MNPAPLHAAPHPTPHLSRVAGALCIGALYGAGLVSANLVVINLFGDRPGDGPFLAIIAFPVALVGWGAGLVVIGCPVWMLLHAFGVTSRWIGAAVGGSITAFVAPPLLTLQALDLLDADHGMAWPHWLANVASFGVIGAIVGWAVALRAYGRQENFQ